MTTFRLVREPLPVATPLALDPAQRRVVDHAAGPLLVLAGPGTGKTATLVEAVAARVEAGADPERLLVLTFSRRAAAELRERLARRLGSGHVPPTGWTFHAWCLQVLDLLRQSLAVDGSPPEPRPTLIGGPEQDVVVRELLAGDARDGGRWPAELEGILALRGMSAEVRALIGRAQTLGLTPADLDDAGARAGRADWRAVARFYEQYRDVLAPQHLLDQGELIVSAASLAATPAGTAALRRAYDAVWVDEYQDTDPRQEALLHAVAGDGRDLVVVGDPDQSIYAFRGADVRGILRMTERFRRADGTPAPVVALRTGRRSGSALVEVARRVADGLPTPGLSVVARREHRALTASREGGAVEVLLFPSAGAEADGIADLLRRAHLDDGVPWDAMAVLVRSGRRSIPLLRRVLGAAGVPVEVAGDELPLAAEPAVATLIAALRCADDPGLLDEARCAALLASPLVRADAADLRRAGRLLRQAEGGPAPSSSAALRCRAVADPATLALLGEQRCARPLRLLADLLRSARAVLTGGGSADEALWELWTGSRWDRRAAAVAGGRGPDARAADRELDAVLALFDTVARAQERRVGVGVPALLDMIESQTIPAGTQDERRLARPGVRLLTAHRSKGLEWPLVVVAGVQDGGWPDLRRRGSLLDPDALDPDGPPGRADLLADERRLFYVACTRARDRLVATAVDGAADDGARPSRFLDALGVDPTTVARRPQRPRTLAGLVAELRRLALATDPAVAGQAAARLARLAAAVDGEGAPLVPAADPATWWGVAPPTEGPAPYDPEIPLSLSASTVTALDECALRWLLSHEVHAETPASPAMSFGKVVHALAERMARGPLSADAEALTAELGRVWHALGYDAPYLAAAEHRAAQAALARLVDHVAATGRTLVGAEVGFDDVVETPGGPVRVRGRLDRVEADADGGLHVVDLKTGKQPVSKDEASVHPQLRLYQYAVDSGLVEGVEGTAAGAELWYLRREDSTGLAVRAQQPQDHAALLEQLGAARRQIVAERFPAMPDPEVCARCVYRICCPAVDAGRQVV